MAETSWPFDGGTTYEDGWAQMARLFAPSVVEAGSLNQLNYVNSSGFVGALDSGTAWVRGFAYKNDSSKSLTHANPPATSGFSRNDLVVLHLDRSANSVVATIVPGTAATTGSQVDPALTRNDVTGVWELPIWRVVVTNGATALGAITDLRGLYDPQLALIWTNFTGFAAGANAGSPTPQWSKEPGTGLVRFRGQIAASTNFAASGVDIISSLPAAIVPSFDRRFALVTSFASVNHPARVDITATGKLQFFVSNADTIVSGYLEDIAYHVT